MENRQSKIQWFIGALALLLDQLSKLLSERCLMDKPISLIPGVLELHYLENRGAAWGMLQGARFFFIPLTVLLVGLLVWFYIRERKQLSALSSSILFLILAGALGNFIDRLFLGYVRDMIYVSLIDFPVFNIADSAIVIGAGLLVIETLSKRKGLLDIAENYFKSKKKQEEA